MAEFVCRRTGQVYDIGEQIDHGGHAEVHAVGRAESDLALKRYPPETLQRRPDLEARIKAMIARPPAYRPDRSAPVLCAWPEDAAYVSGHFTGFVMPRVDATSASTIQEIATRHDTTWRDRVAVAENLARAVAVLHDSDVVIGDFRERNLLAWSDCRVTLLGCDRMQVEDPVSARRFPCVTERNACTPPELLLASLSSTLRTSSSDIFPLALNLHLLLLHGAHPFRGQWKGHGNSPAEHVLAQDGLWSYAGDRRLGPYPESPPLTVLPQQLQRYFRAAFVDGARNPQARPSAQAWLTELTRLRECLLTCAFEPSHVYGDHLRSCPWCRPSTGSASGAGSVPPGCNSRLVWSPLLPAGAAAPADTAAALTEPHTVAVAMTRSAPATQSNRGTPSSTEQLESAPRRRPRSRLRVAAWLATALVGIGGVVGVSTAAHRSAPPVIDPAVIAQTDTPSTRSAVPRPDDPTEALEQIRAHDAPVVESLAESWVAQLSARPAGTKTADQAATDGAILSGHAALRRQYPDAVLLWSPDWNYAGRFWITVMNEKFPTAGDANTWCDTHRFAPQDCFAKKLSRSGVVTGTERYRR
jgi:hypothetical protein